MVREVAVVVVVAKPATRNVRNLADLFVELLWPYFSNGTSETLFFLNATETRILKNRKRAPFQKPSQSIKKREFQTLKEIQSPNKKNKMTSYTVEWGRLRPSCILYVETKSLDMCLAQCFIQC